MDDQRDYAEEAANQRDMEREGLEERQAEEAELAAMAEQYQAAQDAYAQVVVGNTVTTARHYELTITDRVKVRSDLLKLGYSISDLYREAMCLIDMNDLGAPSEFVLVDYKGEVCWVDNNLSDLYMRNYKTLYGPVKVSGWVVKP